MKTIIKMPISRFFIFIIIMITFESVSGQNATENNKDIDPIYNICYNGVPDVVVRIANDEVYIFKGNTYWRWIVDSPSTTKVTDPRMIRDDWPPLTSDLDFGVTIFSETAKWSDTSN